MKMGIKRIKDIEDAVDTAALMARPLTEWRPVLAEECQVYVFGEAYLGKRFDAINFKFCQKDEAKEILVDNLYALLRYKYFPFSTEETDKRINDIVSSFTSNLKTTLKKVSFDSNGDCSFIKTIPDSCVAFRNGVFDFAKNDWLFKYDIIRLPQLSNAIYLYDPSYAILWYLDYDFESLDVNISELSLEEFVDLMKEYTKTSKNYCFELMYNISHDLYNKFSLEKFSHLCEVLGYTMLQSFSQYFVMLIGAGQNGKNSLFDGCFSNKVVPRPASNDLDSIENDRFITGALENRSHNIFLETSAKTYNESKMIKALTGSMYQTIESKGISKYSGIINCKYIFAGNDQDKIKFSDNTTGFRRRINMLEIYYQWDSEKRFLKNGDYYDTSFSDDLSELKDDILNTSVYVYFAMYGIYNATKGFTQNFKFSKNDWNLNYVDIDLDLKTKIENIDNESLYGYIRASKQSYEDGKTMMFDLDRNRIYLSPRLKEIGINNYDKFVDFLWDKELFMSYFMENDVYFSVKTLQNLVKDYGPTLSFTSSLKKIYGVTNLLTLSSNKSYVKVSFYKNKMKILK